MHGFTTNNKAVPLYCIFHNHNHIGVSTHRAGGLQPPCKRSRYSNRAVGITRINKAHKIIVKQVVYDEFIKQIRTVRDSFNTTGTANCRILLVVLPSTIIIILFSKEVNKQVY